MSKGLRFPFKQNLSDRKRNRFNQVKEKEKQKFCFDFLHLMSAVQMNLTLHNRNITAYFMRLKKQITLLIANQQFSFALFPFLGHWQPKLLQFQLSFQLWRATMRRWWACEASIADHLSCASSPPTPARACGCFLVSVCVSEELQKHIVSHKTTYWVSFFTHCSSPQPEQLNLH